MSFVHKLPGSPAPLSARSSAGARARCAAEALKDRLATKVVEATSVLVGYDYGEARSTEIPERRRRRLTE
jgi:hypothetical protein